jgi:site-specific recombinase
VSRKIGKTACRKKSKTKGMNMTLNNYYILRAIGRARQKQRASKFAGAQMPSIAGAILKGLADFLGLCLFVLTIAGLALWVSYR